MAGYQSFSLNAVEEAQSSSAAAYREFLRRPGFSMGMYLLPAAARMPSTRTARTRSTPFSTAGPSSKSKVRPSTSAQATSSRWTAAGTTTSLTSPRIWPSWSSSLRPTTQKPEGAVSVPHDYPRATR